MIRMYHGSGMAKCKLCVKIIEKNELQINFQPNGKYHSNENYHFSCIVNMEPEEIKLLKVRK